MRQPPAPDNQDQHHAASNRNPPPTTTVTTSKPVSGSAFEPGMPGFVPPPCTGAPPWPPPGLLPSKADNERWAERIQALRGAVGDEVDIAIDAHGRLSTAASLGIVPLLEPVRPLFIEEPVLPEHTANLHRIVASTPIPIAAGERLFSRPGLRGAVRRRRRSRPTRPLARWRNLRSPPHSRRRRNLRRRTGPHTAHWDRSGSRPVSRSTSPTPNFLIQEQSLDLGHTDDNGLLAYLKDPSVFTMSDGYVTRPTGAGLGIDIDENAVREAATAGHIWRPPLWQHADGSHAEW